MQNGAKQQDDVYAELIALIGDVTAINDQLLDALREARAVHDALSQRLVRAVEECNEFRHALEMLGVTTVSLHPLN